MKFALFLALCVLACLPSLSAAWETYDDPYKGWTLEFNDTSTLQCTGYVKAYAKAPCNQCTKNSGLVPPLDVYVNCTETYAEVHAFPSMDGKCRLKSVPTRFVYGCISGQLTALVPPVDYAHTDPNPDPSLP